MPAFDDLVTELHAAASPLEFAREHGRDAPPGDPRHALIVLAHIDAYIDRRSSPRLPTRARAVFTYFNRRSVRREIESASDLLLSGADDFAGDPAWPFANQAFAFAFDDRGDVTRSRRHLLHGGDDPIWPWGAFGDDDETYRRARRRAGLDR